MHTKILVPLDGSKLAEVALPYAEELAGRSGFEIVLVHVNERGKGHPEEADHSYLQQMVEMAKEGARSYPSKPGLRPEIEVTPVILSGYPAEKIVEYADGNDIGTIVMASHGQSGVRLWALGSVAEKVVRATTRPVLLIRGSILGPDVRKKGVMGKVLVPLDGSKESEAIIPIIEEFGPKFKAHHILLEVIARGYSLPDRYIALTAEQLEADKKLATAYLERVAARLKEKGISVATEERLVIEIRFGNDAEQIIKLADEVQIDLVAMTTHGRSGVGRSVFGSVAERVFREGHTPLLLIRPPGARGEKH